MAFLLKSIDLVYFLVWSSGKNIWWKTLSIISLFFFGLFSFSWNSTKSGEDCCFYLGTFGRTTFGSFNLEEIEIWDYFLSILLCRSVTRGSYWRLRWLFETKLTLNFGTIFGWDIFFFRTWGWTFFLFWVCGGFYIF